MKGSWPRANDDKITESKDPLHKMDRAMSEKPRDRKSILEGVNKGSVGKAGKQNRSREAWGETKAPYPFGDDGTGDA